MRCANNLRSSAALSPAAAGIDGDNIVTALAQRFNDLRRARGGYVALVAGAAEQYGDSQGDTPGNERRGSRQERLENMLRVFGSGKVSAAPRYAVTAHREERQTTATQLR